jgi:hypothetical protein
LEQCFNAENAHILYSNQGMDAFNKPPKSRYMSYRIARCEQGVLTYEPCKSYLLPPLAIPHFFNHPGIL